MALFIPNVPASSELSLPPEWGLTSSAICEWYEGMLRRAGAVVTRTADDELEFDAAGDSPWGADADRAMRSVAGGEIWVDPAPTGFSVHARIRPVWWAVALPLGVVLIGGGSLSMQDGLLKYLLAFGGLPLVLWVWGNIWVAWAMLLNRTNRAIEQSYIDRPPSAPQSGAAV
jgi:hypothetical protein